ncbi:MAG: helix-turn-helix domain-containing protein [Phycisphaerales bacterium JB063]
MSRRSNQQYICEAIRRLASQLLYAPADRRAEDIRRAETLHDELDPAQNYPFEFLAYRITAHRLPDPDDATLVGEAVLPDLRLLIDSLSRSIALPPSQEEPELTTAQLAKQQGVSEKTVARWRRAGLRWRWVTLQPGGQKGVVFPASAVSYFLKTQPKRADSAKAFKRMTSDERRRAIEQARAIRMAEPTISLNQAARRVASQVGRGHETIRELLQKHDRERPEAALFADHDAPLTGRQRAAIERAYREGEPVESIAERYGRTRSTVYRAVHNRRAQRALGVSIGYISEPTFERDDADEVLLRPIAPPGPRARRLDERALGALPASLRDAFDRPLPPDRLMVALLLRYNYLKHLCKHAQAELQASGAQAKALDRFESLYGRAQRARSSCCHTALPLILSVCRRQHAAGSDADRETLPGLLLSAFHVLAELVETHDAARSARFESVLTNRLLRTFAQTDRDSPPTPDSAWRELQQAVNVLGPDDVGEVDAAPSPGEAAG